MELVSAGDLAKVLDKGKSTITFYQSIGLIVPIGVAGKTMVFNKAETTERLKKIEKFKKKGKTLEEIKTLLNENPTV